MLLKVRSDAFKNPIEGEAEHWVCYFQAECDELAQRVKVLKDKSASLRTVVNRIRSVYEQLLSENEALKVIFKMKMKMPHRLCYKHVSFINAM